MTNIPADSPAGLCDMCNEPVDASQTAVAVMLATGTPALVHPACYPAFSSRERGRGHQGYSASPFERKVAEQQDARA